jgi:hypothetical protein
VSDEIDCARALAFDAVDVTRIDRTLRTAPRAEHETTSAGKVVALPGGRFARDVSAFVTKPTDGGAKRGTR